MPANTMLTTKLSKSRAKSHYICFKCGSVIEPDDTYYRLYVIAKRGKDTATRAIEFHNLPNCRPRLGVMIG